MQAAIFGTWHWKQILNKISDSNHFQGSFASANDPADTNQTRLFELFDEIDENKDGFLDHMELLNTLIKADVDITSGLVKMLIQSADDNNDGLISREEWEVLIKRMRTSSTSSRKSLSSERGVKRKVSRHRVMAHA